MKEEIKALIAEARQPRFPNNEIVQRLCDALQKSARFNDDTLQIKLGLAEENQRLRSRNEELETICAESYQVVGILADAAGVFETSESVSGALDNLSQAKLVHTDVLPFELEEKSDSLDTQKTVSYPIAASIGMTGIPPMSPECFRQHAILSAMNGMLAAGRWDDVTELVADAVIAADALVNELAK